jgi:hypothetical protein
LDNAALIQERWKLQVFLISERRGASRQFFLKSPAGRASPLIKVALFN